LRSGPRLNTHVSLAILRVDEMRRLIVLCSAFLLVIGSANAQRGDAPAPVTTAPAKPPAAQKKRVATPKPIPDTRPRYKRDDTPAPVAAPVAPARQIRRARKPADAAQPAVADQSTKSTLKDVAECVQVNAPDQAIAGCTRVIEDPRQKPKGRAAAFYNRGNAHEAKGARDAAIADYDEAIKLEPKNARAFNNRGSARSDKGDTEAALADFDAALKLDRRLASAYFNRANLHAAKGETARAIEDYSKALQFNRRNVNAYIARGALYLADGAAAKARADMRQALALDRKNAYAVIWHEIAERRAKQKGVLAGGKGLEDIAMSGWPAPVLHMFVGELKADGVLVAADDPDATRKQAHICEANFYSGQHALIGGNRDEAAKLFKAAAKECPHGFIEGIMAGAELKGLGEKL
jgi:lipoprotein NlpI